MKLKHLDLQKASQRALVLAVLVAGAASLQAAAPSQGPKVVNLDEKFLWELRIISFFLIAILLLLLNIFILLKVKDPSTLTLKYILGHFVGKDSPDPVMHHTYDGIQELDNPMPAWLRWTFYGSIVFAFVYLLHYQFLRTGPSSRQEYEIEMAAAAEQFKDVELPDDAIIAITDPGRLQFAAGVFKENCATCHGDKLQGLTGPNLTDAYWLHGGDIKEVYHTITEGVPGKTMISWKRLLPSQDRLALASYVLSLQGSNPAGAKDPEGVPAGQGGAPADSSAMAAQVAADTAAPIQ